jgi:hypothetical protein
MNQKRLKEKVPLNQRERLFLLIRIVPNKKLDQCENLLSLWAKGTGAKAIKEKIITRKNVRTKEVIRQWERCQTCLDKIPNKYLKSVETTLRPLVFTEKGNG